MHMAHKMKMHNDNASKFLAAVIFALVGVAAIAQPTGCPAMPLLPMNPSNANTTIPEPVKQKLITKQFVRS